VEFNLFIAELNQSSYFRLFNIGINLNRLLKKNKNMVNFISFVITLRYNYNLPGTAVSETRDL